MEGWRENLLLGHYVVLLAFGGQSSFRLITVALALAVLLVRIVYTDSLAQEILPVHVRQRGVGGLERVKADETIPLGDVVVVAHNVGLAEDLTEGAEGVVEDLFVDLGVEVVDKKLGANVDRLLLVGGRLIDAEGLAVNTDAIQTLGGVLGGFGGVELDEAVALVVAGDAVEGHMDLADGADLGHELREELLGKALVYVADVDGGIFVLLPKKEEFSHVESPDDRHGGNVCLLYLWEMLCVRGKTYQCFDILGLSTPVVEKGGLLDGNWVVVSSIVKRRLSQLPFHQRSAVR